MTKTAETETPPDENTIEALASMTTGLYLLTTGTTGSPYGMVASWAVQVSYRPPIVLVAVRRNRRLHDLIPRFGCFGLNVLPSEAADSLAAFKINPKDDQFRDEDLFAAGTGAPLIRRAIAWLDCRLTDTVRPGDHTVFFGRVEAGGKLSRGSPLSSQEYDHVYLGRR